MAEVDTSVYKNLQPQDPLKQPLAIMQLLGVMNQNRLQQQLIDANQGVSDSFRDNVNSDGTPNYETLNRAVAGSAGQKAPEVLNAISAHMTTQNALRQSQQDAIQKRIGAVGAADEPTMKDIHAAAIQAAKDNPTIDQKMITSRLDEANEIFKKGGSKALKKWTQIQGVTAPNFSALEGEAGEPIEGRIPQIPKAAAVLGRANVSSGKNGPGLFTTNPPGFDTAAAAVGGQSANMANSLTSANDTSMQRKGMLGNLEEDLTKFTAGPAADWTKVAKAWYNRNVPKPKGWDFDPASIASQEQFVKQSNMLANAQFQALGGTGTDNQFNATFHTSPNELLSEMGNKGIIRLLKGNEDAIQAKNKAWRQWVSSGNGPQTYPQFSEQFNDRFDPRAFQFKYIPQEERQSYIDKMVPEERQRFLHDLTFARKQGWINFEASKK